MAISDFLDGVFTRKIQHMVDTYATSACLRRHVKKWLLNGAPGHADKFVAKNRRFNSTYSFGYHLTTDVNGHYLKVFVYSHFAGISGLCREMEFRSTRRGD